MDAEAKVDRRRPPGQRLHIPLGSKDIDLLWKEVKAYRIQKLPAILEILAPIEKLAQPEEVSFRLIQGSLALLIGPVGGNPLLRRPVHFMGSDLDLHGLPLGADHGRVKRLVHVGLGDGNEVLEPARDRLPEAVDHS